MVDPALFNDPNEFLLKTSIYRSTIGLHCSSFLLLLLLLLLWPLASFKRDARREMEK